MGLGRQSEARGGGTNGQCEVSCKRPEVGSKVSTGWVVTEAVAAGDGQLRLGVRVRWGGWVVGWGFRGL